MNIKLDEFWDSLLKQVEKEKITLDTARTYYSCMKIISGFGFEYESIKSFLKNKVSYKAKLSQYISAIKKYETSVLKTRKGLISKQLNIDFRGTNREQDCLHRNQGSGLSTDTIIRKINALSNKKLKYAFRLQYKSGLRVSEISKLTKYDLEFLEDGKIKIKVRDGKGRKSREVDVLEDEYLYKNLKEYVDNAPKGKLFYSRDYLKQKADEYGFETHDLRRSNAKKRLETEIKNGKGLRKAKKVVQKELGHASVSTTEIYLH